MSQHVLQHPLPRISPESIGLASQHIVQMTDDLKAAGINPHAFLLLRRGQVFAEGYYAPYGPLMPQTVYSLSKSFTSVAIGLAAADGKIGLDEHLVDLFPDDLPDVISPELKALTLRDCLRMATGQPKEPELASRNPVRTFLATPFSEMPGQIFRYNTAATYMLSAALKTKGIDLEAYLQERIFNPLGVSGIRWMRSPQGICTGGFGMSALPELIAKFGQLILQKGRWQNQQLIDPAYLEQATAKQIETQNDDKENADRNGDWSLGYGYQFWQTRDGSFRGDGMYGQYCLVVPDRDFVLAMTAFTDDLQKELDIVFDRIVANLSDTPLPDDPDAAAALKTHLSTLRIDWSAPVDDGQPLDSHWSGTTWTLAEHAPNHPFGPRAFNRLRIEPAGHGLRLIMDDDVLDLKDKAWQLHELPDYGMLRWPTQLLTAYGLENGRRLTVRLFWLEMLLKLEYVFDVSDQNATLTVFDCHGPAPEQVFRSDLLPQS